VYVAVRVNFQADTHVTVLAILAAYHRSNISGLETLYLIDHIVNPTGTTPASVVVFSIRLARLAITLLDAFLKRFLVNVFSHCQPSCSMLLSLFGAYT
jgi:hypothetical protein